MKSICSNLGAALVQILVVANLVIMGAYGAPQVPCYFIFGDSIADNGNSNLLETEAKANYAPYGIDFPFGPTGRFTNGRTIVDVISEKLGFRGYIKPFATANDRDILSGVNYAFSSAGILEETGSSMGEVISFSKQVSNHKETIQRLSKQLGSKNATKYLNKCLYSIGIGTNDYLHNYFQPQDYSSSKNYTLFQFTNLLLNQYADQIKVLYGEGARKFVIFELGRLGCVPALRKGSSCVPKVDAAAMFFNQKLTSLKEKLNKDFSDAKFISIASVMIDHDAQTMTEIEASAYPCCPESSNGQCVQGGDPCHERETTMFWDGYHKTEAYNVFYGRTSYKAEMPYHVHPYDIQTLIGLSQGVVAAE